MASTDLRALLNPEQYEAATVTEGPLLILAGAGSGKTRVLVHRIAHLIETGRAAPHQIFAVTFTNKAAGEMRERLEKMMGASVHKAWIGTFHALSARMLRYEGHRLGFTSSFTIYDDDDSKRLLRAVAEDAKVDTKEIPLAQVAHEIDRAKNRGMSPKQLAAAFADVDDPAKRLARKLYGRYQDALRRSNAMDFGDILIYAVELLRHHPEARDRFQSRFRYVMVDEFQDTNGVQYEFLRLLVGKHQNLAVVGDDDQSIYRWRGAEVANILHFRDLFPEAKVVRLEENYRSSANILDAANAVIRRNTKRHAKTLRTQNDPGSKVGLAIVGRAEDEAALVARAIATRLAEGERPEHFAILYRSNAQSRLFEEALRRARIRYVLIGGTGFYDRLEVKDIIAYLRLTTNPSSRGDFERVVATPPRGIGDKTLALLKEAAEPFGLEGARMLELDEREMVRVGLKPAAIAKLRAFGAQLASFRALAETAAASEVAKAVVREIGYIEHLQKSDPHTSEDRVLNIDELISSIAEHESSLAEAPETDDDEGLGLAGAKTPLAAFLDTAALVSSNDVPEAEGAVSLLTLHGAKGLEFPFVFMVGMEEGTFPTKRAIEEGPEAMEEERRLAYVGMTRAMKELCLLAAAERRVYGALEPRRPSRFLGELPDHVVGPVGGAPSASSRPTAESRPASWSGRSDGMAFAPRAAPARRVARGEDEIVYDADVAPPFEDFERGGGPIGRGSRVLHDAFGVGTVEDLDGRGPSARLTIRFRGGDVRRIVARFVRSAEES